MPTNRHVLRFPAEADAARFSTDAASVQYWYHSFYFDQGTSIRGIYDPGSSVHEYMFPSLEGATVLDVGPASGWYTTYFEQSGARVSSVDLRGWCDYDLFGRYEYPAIETEKAQPDSWDRGSPIYWSPAAEGFPIIRRHLNLKSVHRNARVYDLSPRVFDGDTFQLVFAGSVLMHLRDPVGALCALRRVTEKTLVATTYLAPSLERYQEPLMMYTGWSDIEWWVANRACVAKWLEAAGFSRFDLSNRVTLKSDKPYVDAKGKIHGKDQEHMLIIAEV